MNGDDNADHDDDLLEFSVLSQYHHLSTPTSSTSTVVSSYHHQWTAEALHDISRIFLYKLQHNNICDSQSIHHYDMMISRNHPQKHYHEKSHPSYFILLDKHWLCTFFRKYFITSLIRWFHSQCLHSSLYGIQWLTNKYICGAICKPADKIINDCTCHDQFNYY